MFHLEVDPDWYEKYWFSDRPAPRRRPFAGSLTKFAMLVALLAGGGAVLGHYHASHGAAGFQDWEQE